MPAKAIARKPREASPRPRLRGMTGAMPFRQVGARPVGAVALVCPRGCGPGASPQPSPSGAGRSQTEWKVTVRQRDVRIPSPSLRLRLRSPQTRRGVRGPDCAKAGPDPSRARRRGRRSTTSIGWNRGTTRCREPRSSRSRSSMRSRTRRRRGSGSQGCFGAWLSPLRAEYRSGNAGGLRREEHTCDVVAWADPRPGAA